RRRPLELPTVRAARRWWPRGVGSCLASCPLGARDPTQLTDGFSMRWKRRAIHRDRAGSRPPNPPLRVVVPVPVEVAPNIDDIVRCSRQRQQCCRGVVDAPGVVGRGNTVLGNDGRQVAHHSGDAWTAAPRTSGLVLPTGLGQLRAGITAGNTSWGAVSIDC